MSAYETRPSDELSVPPRPPRRAVALRHVAFEDLGDFAPPLRQAGYAITYLDAGSDAAAALDPLAPDLLFVLGGPIGANDEKDYPFLTAELRLIEARLAAARPVFGICLGAQLMARALGARVMRGPAKEIGFGPVNLTEAGRASCLAPLAEAPVLHWHGDTFDLPSGAAHLAATEIFPSQAFAYGPAAIATQFHPEAAGGAFERWLIGHSLELATARLSVTDLRAEHARLRGDLAAQAARCLQGWLAALDPAA